MTRIELSDNSAEEIRELREEIKKQKVRPKVIKQKRRSACSTCCLIVFLVILGLAFFTLTALAKTGLFQVPVFSSLFWEEPKPMRIVSLDGFENIAFEEIFNKKIEEQIQRQVKLGGKENKDVSIDFSFSERQLTGLLKGIEEQAGPNIKDPQIAVSPEEIEFFSKLILQNRQTFLTLGFRPIILDGKPDLELTSLKLGNLSLPTFLANFFVNSFLDTKVEDLVSQIPRELSLQSIDLDEGLVIVKSKVKLEDLIQ